MIDFYVLPFQQYIYQILFKNSVIGRESIYYLFYLFIILV